MKLMDAGYKYASRSVNGSKLLKSIMKVLTEPLVLKY
jgi:hypothetical protein